MYDYTQIEKQVAEHWARHKIPESISTFDAKSTKKKFYLLDGPPYANGLPHAGHVMTVVFKDVWGKFKHMQGHEVWFQPGFDCHGLPIENKVEKKIGVASKQDIEKFGVDKFIAECRQFATEYIHEWMKFYKDVGAWKGWLKPYLTLDNSYIESGWWTFKSLHEKGLLVQGEKPIHWCPHCQTTISGYEATDSYKNVEDPAIYAKFPVVGQENTYILVFTTTGWTLPANVALAVHPEEMYVKVDALGEKFILAKALLQEVMKKNKIPSYDVLEEFSGSKLEGTRYLPLLDVPIQQELHKNELTHRVVLSIPMLKKTIASKVAEKKGISSDVSDEEKFGHLVTMDTGTGVVHIAPGHGAEDNKLGLHYKLPVISPVDDACNLIEGTGFEGIFVKDADKQIIQYLQEHNRLFKAEKINHSYPLCWRCKSPLIFRVTKQWFFTIDQFKQDMIKQNEQVNWLPPFAKARMHNWMESANDWCISIQRYWGIPLPIWHCTKCEKYEVFGSKKEIETRMTNNIELDDLHKHVVDRVELSCSSCKGTMQKIPDLMNIWVESGIAPWASLGYPAHDNGLFEKLWNVDLIDESQDQIRGWFYALAFMGMATFEKIPYNTVCLNGWTLDEKGEKMSKSVGNVISADDCLSTLGADVLRLYNCYNIAPWETHRFSLNEGKELFKVMNVLANLENFVQMYKLEFSSEKITVTHIEDRWMLSKLHTLIEGVTNDLENFRFHFAGRKLSDFILNEFSRWYMKIAKERLANEENVDHVAYVFKEVVLNYLKLLAPICPYITEKIYLSLFAELDGKTSIHYCEYPVADKKLIDHTLEQKMAIVEKVTEITNSVRQENNIKLKWPLRSVTLTGSDIVKQTVKDLESFLLTSCNVKNVIFDPSVSLTIEAKPNFAVIGPKYGVHVGKVVAHIKKTPAAELKKLLADNKVVIDSITLSKEDVLLVESMPASVHGRTFDEGAVIVDLTRDEKLEQEAFVREFIREVQVTRKEKGLKLDDVIQLTVDGPTFLQQWKTEIEEGTTSKVVFGKNQGKEVSLEDLKVVFEISSS